MHMKKRKSLGLVLLLLFCLTGFFASGEAQTTPPGKPVILKLATLDVGSSWYGYGATFAEMIHRELPKGSRVDVLPYSGSIGNPKLVSRGEVDMGLAMGVAANWAYNGKFMFDQKYQELRGLVGGIDQYYYGAILRDEVKINSLREVKEKKAAVKIVTQPEGTLNAVMSYQVLEAYGLTKEDIRQLGGTITHTSTDVIAADMRDGRANLWFQPITLGHPSVTDVALTTKIRFLPYEPEIVKKLTEAYGFSAVTLKGGSFQGQKEDVPMIGYTTGLFASAKMPESVAYAITKALCDGEKKLKATYKGMNSFNPASAWDSKITGLPLHPGAKKYYREKGYMK
jgi:TRAP transporter TAXI family solute receptor